jgi:hypothetical protein
MPALAEHAPTVGNGLIEAGRFDEARPWFGRAVEAAQRGDMHGRVDHQSLGKSLHQVGCCHASMGRLAEARTWFERAALAQQKGDVHGRIDHQSLGISLKALGDCREKLGLAP